MNNSKYFFECRSCHTVIDGFEQWFSDRQQCPDCGSKWVDVRYHAPLENLKKLVAPGQDVRSLFHYFDFLPLLDPKNIISDGEGAIPVDRWIFLEEFAREVFRKDLTVLAYRNDLNGGTGTFKDVAAAVVGSVLKEHRIPYYCVASTGNIANAFAHYLAKAGVSLAVFIPIDALKANEAGVSCYGQTVFRVQGDYALAKKIAAEYAAEHQIFMSGGNIDPARVEAKKTQVFEWIRQLGYIPDVYIQALAGGTGPIAIDKALRDLDGSGIANRDPRYFMVQASGCDPMTVAWNDARDKGFPEGWQNDFPVFDNPVTQIPTLANGNPQTFPIIGSLCKKTGGDILTFDEGKAVDIARLVAFETGVKIGPAATIAVGGFFEGLKNGLFHDGERIMINIGEGVRRSPELMEEMIYTTREVSSVNDCQPISRMSYRDKLWQAVTK